MIKLMLILALGMSTAFAQRIELETRILTPSQITKIIGPYPQAGSWQEEEDFRILMQYQQKRGKSDCAQAKRDEDLSVETMFGGEIGILNEEETIRMTILLLKAYAGAGFNALIAKQAYKRPRPYVTNPRLKPCISLESSYAYPSGHSLTVRLFARIIGEVYPERAELLLGRANQYALNRVVGGVHHPSDVSAAFILADYLAERMIEREDFLNVLSEL